MFERVTSCIGQYGFSLAPRLEEEEVSMSNRVSLQVWAATLVLGLGLLGGCQQQPESPEAGEEAASSDAVGQAASGGWAPV